MTLEPTTIRPILNRIIELLETKCVSPNGNAVEWRNLFAARQRSLESSSSPEDLERRVTEALEEGGLSHVAFFHDTAQHVPARYAICATFLAAETSEGRRWMFQDVHDGGPAHQAGARPGDLLLQVNDSTTAPPALPRFPLGQDTEMLVLDREGRAKRLTVRLPKPDPKRGGKGTPPMAQPTPVTSRTLDERTGYIKVAFFPGATGQPFARAFDDALAALGQCDRLVVDLRGNLGGFVGALRLMSHLTPDRVPIGYSLTRRGVDRGWRPEQLPYLDRLPATGLDKLSMLLRFKVLHRDRSIRLMTEGLGRKPFHGRIVMLINEHTASAAEMVAGFAAERRLATLIGMRTAGQVLGGANFAVGPGFTLRLPAAAWHRWSGDTLEGVGIAPDLIIPMDPRALAAGMDPQLQAATGEFAFR